MRKLFSFFSLLILFLDPARSQSINVYPSNWWVDMKLNKVQLMIHRTKVAEERISMTPYPGVHMTKQSKVENPNYLFIDLTIDKSAKSGTVKFRIDHLQSPEAFPLIEFGFELKTRRPGNGTSFAQGLNSSDLVYLLMPDRFSNGDLTNDRIAGMRDQSLDRKDVRARHGADLKGVINHLDYLQDLGITSVWMTPVIENDMPKRTEHGYAFTDQYKIERRLGGDAEYSNLSDELHKRKMKLIQDAVYNHIGSYHFTVLDPPMKDWLNQWPSYTQTNYKNQTAFDPYAAPTEKYRLVNGWFAHEMPDVNQNNPFAANYLIQHAIWTVETFGVDAWRIDTYIYNDLNFMNRCNKALTDDYPKITMFGETWVHGVINQSYFCQNNYAIPFKSNLTATMDFQMLFDGIVPTVSEPFGEMRGVDKLYNTAAQDFVYKDPTRQVIFLDNHDMDRFYTRVSEDTAKYKLGLGWLLTFRGVPQLYYGDEILMTGSSNPSDGNVRRDFLGGWKEDSVNKFESAGRTEKEENIFQFIKTLGNYRKNSSAIKYGKMMQYSPADGLYVYFRYDNKQTVMVVMNAGSKEKNLDSKHYQERIAGFSKAVNVVNGNEWQFGDPMKISGNQIMIMELKK
jgi:neopullulanase